MAELILLQVVVWGAFLTLVGCALVYGFLSPWWTHRTGIGFLSTKIAFSVVIGLTLPGLYGIEIPLMLVVLAFLLVIITVNVGVTWNIIYKQLIEGKRYPRLAVLKWRLFRRNANKEG